MTVEKDVLLSLLRLTHSGQVQRELIASDAKVPATVTAKALRKILQEDLFHENEGLINATPRQRIGMAVHAIKFGADFERVCSLLSWNEFESIAAQAFEANNYTVVRNFRFKQASKRWEIDILGFKRPLIISVDCKHWKRAWGKAAIMKSVKSQIERTKALTDAFPAYHQKAGIEDWETATFVPIILSLIKGSVKFYNDVPIVPVFQIQDFISNLPFQISLLKYFSIKSLKLNQFFERNNQLKTL